MPAGVLYGCTTYVETLRHELIVAAEAGGPEAVALAERLTAPLDSAARLVLLEALSAAADEITLELAPGSVDVRLRGRDPESVVTPPLSDQRHEDTSSIAPDLDPSGAGPSTPPGSGEADDGGTLADHAPTSRAFQAPDRRGGQPDGYLGQCLARPCRRCCTGAR